MGRNEFNIFIEGLWEIGMPSERALFIDLKGFDSLTREEFSFKEIWALKWLGFSGEDEIKNN